MAVVLGLIGPGDEGFMLLQNVRNYAPIKTVSHLRRLESQVRLL
jgi:hypothetical protein